MASSAQMIAPDKAGIEHAGRIIQDGGLVAFPTETVFGLGADANNDRAVARIFEAKGRPSFNPLIVHLASAAAAAKIADIPPVLGSLAQAFWPGPLTLVTPLKPGAPIAPLVTAGLPTIALRVPDALLARQLIDAAGTPIAAPSANPSGRISATTAAHVASGLGDRIDAILTGGHCTVGLESTIIGLQNDRPCLLRPGGLPVETIEAHIGQKLTRHSGDINAPGQLTSHYAPQSKLRLNAGAPRGSELYLAFGNVPEAFKGLDLSPSKDLLEAAANLFKFLHQLDDIADKSPIAVAPIPEQGLGIAINDRLRRAAA
jgi:L-threonylcarbamoyladenylate synthase